MFEQWQPWWDIVLLITSVGFWWYMCTLYERFKTKPRGATKNARAKL